jgi:hypothetical protein
MDLNTIYTTCCYGKSVVQWMMIANACMTVYRKSKSLLEYGKGKKQNDVKEKEKEREKEKEEEPFVWIEVVSPCSVPEPIRI